MKTCEVLSKEGFEVNFKFPAFYSVTRFANHVAKVYNNFLEDFPGIIRSLEETQTRLRAGDSKDQDKAQKYAGISNRIMNQKFVFNLCGLCDIYNLYGAVTNLLQTVNMLPHTKYDLFLRN